MNSTLENYSKEVSLRNKIYFAKPQDLLKCSDKDLEDWIILVKEIRSGR